MNSAHHLGFKANDSIVTKLNQFISAVESNNKAAGNHYVDFVE